MEKLFKPHLESSLVALRLKLLSPGVPRVGTQLYLPLKSEVGQFKESASAIFVKPRLKPVRKRISKKKKKELASEVKKQIREKCGEKSESSSSISLNDALAEAIDRASNLKPLDSAEVVTRQPIGYVTYSEHDLSSGQVTATALCSLRELVNLISQSPPCFVLLANVESKFFWTAKLTILLGNAL